MVRVISGVARAATLGAYLQRIPGYTNGAVAERVIRFRIPNQPTVAHGYDAELLVEVCDAYLKARDPSC
jgi:hypothetical protein